MHTLQELLEGLSSAVAHGPTDIAISGVAYDSRKVRPGGLFVAIKGTHTDGHRYIDQALARGAAAIVVDARYWSVDTIARYNNAASFVVAPNSLAALSPIAAAWYDNPGRELNVVGITGTKGKSTTTELTSRVLEGGAHTTGLIGTVDFKIAARQWPNDTRQSTPEALEIQQMLREMVSSGCDYAVLEATSHALSADWNRLGDCDFDVAVFTNVTHEHLDYHGSVEQYRRDKAQLFEMLGQGQEVMGDGQELQAHSPIAHRLAPTAPRFARWAIVNADDPYHHLYLHAAPASARRLTYGMRAAADVRAHAVESTPAGSRFQVTSPWGEGTVALPLPGPFNVLNALAALSVGLSQGVPIEAGIAALGLVAGVRGRMQRVAQGQPFDVIIDYAHNPDSFEQVLGMLRPLTSGRMIAVFGSAGERDLAKRPMQGAIAARYCQLLVLTDEDPRGEDSNAILHDIAAGAEEEGLRERSGYVCIPDRAQAVRFALEQAREGDVVLLLGKGHEGTIQYNGYSIPWDEAAEARAALRELGWNKGDRQ